MMDSGKSRSCEHLADGSSTSNNQAEHFTGVAPKHHPLSPVKNFNCPAGDKLSSVPFTNRSFCPEVTKSSSFSTYPSLTHSASSGRREVSELNARQNHVYPAGTESVGYGVHYEHGLFAAQDRSILHIPTYPSEKGQETENPSTHSTFGQVSVRSSKTNNTADHGHLSLTSSEVQKPSLREDGSKRNPRDGTPSTQQIYPSQPCFPQNEARRVYHTATDSNNQALDFRNESNVMPNYLIFGATAKLPHTMFNFPFPSQFSSFLAPPSKAHSHYVTPPPAHGSFHGPPHHSMCKDGGHVLAEDCQSTRRQSYSEYAKAEQTSKESSFSENNSDRQSNSVISSNKYATEYSNIKLSNSEKKSVKEIGAQLSCSESRDAKQTDSRPPCSEESIAVNHANSRLTCSEGIAAEHTDDSLPCSDANTARQPDSSLSCMDTVTQPPDVRLSHTDNAPLEQPNGRQPCSVDTAVKEAHSGFPSAEEKTEGTNAKFLGSGDKTEDADVRLSFRKDDMPIQEKPSSEIPEALSVLQTKTNNCWQSNEQSTVSENHHSSPRNDTANTTLFTVTPSIYSDSDTDEYVQVEQKPLVRDCFVLMEDEGSRRAKEALNSMCSHAHKHNDDHKTEVHPPKESVRKKRRCTRSRKPVKEEPASRDNSTSDYEPLVQQTSLSARGTGKRRILPSRKKRQCTVSSYVEYSDDDSDDNTVTETRRVSNTAKKQNTNSNKFKNKTSQSIPTRSKCRKTLMKKSAGNRTCPECHKTFTRTDSLTVHMRVHTGDRPFHCQECDATYKVSSHLRNHIRSKHSNTKAYKCGNCSKAFSTSNAKRRHEKTCGKDLSERVKHQCSRCHKKFVTAEGYERHKSQDSCSLEDSEIGLVECNMDGTKNAGGNDTKNEGKSFKCAKCGKAFAEVSGLDCHQQFLCGQAPGAGPYSCPQCNKTFMRWNRYVGHARRHAGDRPYHCSHCNSRFFDRDSLRKHVSRHNGKNIAKCSLCEKQFTVKRSLAMHIMRVHCGMKPYKCNECDGDFASAKLLSTHIRRVHRKEKRFKCQLCGKAFFESQAWMKHMVLHASGKTPSVRGPVQQYPCNLCGKVLNMRNMRLHVSAEHPGVALSEAVTKDLVTCKLCLKEFSDSSSLKIHMIRHSGIKQFKCDQCDMAFVTVHALQLHQRKHTDVRPYSCEECHETFRWRASLRDHKINHHNPDLEAPDADGRRFACKECGQRFKRFNSLKSHMIRHRSVMPCICSECGKGFTDTTRLKIHMSCHSGSDRPFICETCGAGFFYTFLLKRHIQSRHKPSPWLCNLCGRSLCSKDALKRHLGHHANSPDGKVRVGGNRGRTRKPKEPKLKEKKDKKAKDSEEAMELHRGENDHQAPTADLPKNRFEPIPQADKISTEGDFLDFRRASEMQPSSNMYVEQTYPYSSASYVMNPVMWPKPEGN